MDAFKTALVKCLALNVLLTRDFIRDTSKTIDHVRLELPRLLGMCDPASGLQNCLSAKDPKSLLQDFVTSTRMNPLDMARTLEDRGHRDLVFGALKYTRKPAGAEEDDVDALVDELKDILGIAVDPDSVMLAYAAAHWELVKV